MLLAQCLLSVQIHVYPYSYRLSNKRDGCPWPSAVKNTAKYCNSVEGKTRGLPASCKKCSSQNGQQHCCNERPGVLAVTSPLLDSIQGLNCLFFFFFLVLYKLCKDWGNVSGNKRICIWISFNNCLIVGKAVSIFPSLEMWKDVPQPNLPKWTILNRLSGADF